MVRASAPAAAGKVRRDPSGSRSLGQVKIDVEVVAVRIVDIDERQINLVQFCDPMRDATFVELRLEGVEIGCTERKVFEPKVFVVALGGGRGVGADEVDNRLIAEIEPCARERKVRSDEPRRSISERGSTTAMGRLYRGGTTRLTKSRD